MIADHLTAPRLFGVFPLDVTHDVVHIAFGAWGILAALAYVAPVGLVQLGGSDIGLHGFLALGLLLGGMVTARREDREAA